MEVIHEEASQEIQICSLVNQNGHYHQSQFGQRQDFLTRISLICATLGATVTILPRIAFASGVLEGLVVLVIVGCIMWVTCTCFWDSSATGNEIDMSDVVKREIGSRWSRLYDYLHCILLILASLVHFTLTAEFFYPVVQFLIGTDYTANRKDAVFTSFSYQWIGIILCVLLGISLSITKLRLIGIIARVKFFSISLLCVLLLSKINNFYPLPTIPQNSTSVSIFQLVGVMILSFQPHQLSVTILRDGQGHSPKKNISISFIISILMELFITIFGELQIVSSPTYLQGQTILQHFEIDDVLAALTRLSFFISTSCTTVLIAHAFIEKLIFIVRPQQISTFPADRSLKLLVSGILLGGCLIVQMLDIQLLNILSLAGYLCCAPIGILIPICMTLTVKPQLTPQQIMTEQEFKAAWGSPVLSSNISSNDKEQALGITASTDIESEGKTQQYIQESNQSPSLNSRSHSNMHIQIPALQQGKNIVNLSPLKFRNRLSKKQPDENILFVHPGTYQSSKNL